MSDPERIDVQRFTDRVAEVAALATGRRLPAPDLDGALAGEVDSAVPDLRQQRWHATIPGRFAWAQLDDFTGEVADELRSWSRDPAGRNLVLLGAVGTGKTHAAIAAVRAAHDAGLDVAFWPLVELLDALRPGSDAGTFADLADVDRLIVDDLGSERATDWTDERVYALINRRWLEQLPTVATTNLEPEQLREALGPRVYSRLVGNDAVVLRLSGPDRRRT